MASKKYSYNSRAHVSRIFTDLEAYRDFCRDFGYRFDEADLYNMRKYSFQQYTKYINGKRAKNQWEVDRARMYK